MRNLDIITKEIVELSEIKSAFNHYLSSHRSLTEVENATYIQHNRQQLAQSLKALHTELLAVKAEIKRHNIVNKRPLQPITVQYSDEEKNAILHFYRDRRFTITE